MPSPFVTAFGTIAGGQDQSNQASLAYQQQVQQRAMEDQLKRAQLMMQLEDAMSQRKAMEGLKPEDQRALLLGEPYADIQKRQQVGGRVQQYKNLIGQALIDPNRPLTEKQKLLQIYGTIDENTDPGDLDKQLKSFAGLGVKEPARPFQHFTAGNEVKGFEGYDAAGNPIIKTLGTAPAESKTKEHWATESDEFGKPITVKYVSDGAGNVISRNVEGRGKLNVNELKLLDSASSAEQTMGKLQQDLAAIKDAGPVKLAEQYGKYRAPFGIAGAVDPAYAQYFNDLGQLQTDLVGAATSGSSRSYQLINMLKPHIPDPMDPPARALEKAKGFEAGRFKSMREAILGSGAPSDPFGTPAAAPTKHPPGTSIYDGTKLIGHVAPDGVSMIPVGP